MVADGSSGDRWQPRVFFLSELMKAIVFWSGTKTDINGAVSQVRWTSSVFPHCALGLACNGLCCGADPVSLCDESVSSHEVRAHHILAEGVLWPRPCRHGERRRRSQRMGAFHRCNAPCSAPLDAPCCCCCVCFAAQTEAVFQGTRLHMAAFKIQTAVRRMFVSPSARPHKSFRSRLTHCGLPVCVC
jgi:hypothetical protein